MKLDVHVGQPMRLVNPQNEEEQNCRIVRIDETETEFFSVLSSSISQIPSSWPVVFPPSDWEAPRA